MTRRGTVFSSIAGVLLVILIAWIAQHTEWVETKVPMPPRGEARTNPFYAAQKLVERLGARTQWDRVFTEPATGAVLVVSNWQWNLSRSRRERIERWVEAGGRLVIDASVDGGDELEQWSGIVWHELDPVEDEDEEIEHDDDEDAEDGEAAFGIDGLPRCTLVHAEQRGAAGARAAQAALPPRLICGLLRSYVLVAEKEPATWALQTDEGAQVLRVAVGRGSVTAINTLPFMHRLLFDGDHGWLLVAATEMRPGDEIHFLSENEYPSLLALAWMRGAPVVGLGGLLILLLLWRGGVRVGPLAAPPQTARRSLAEQIRGTGQFVLRRGSGAALHAACVRALEEAVRRRNKRYPAMTPDERVAALAELTGGPADALAAALYEPAPAQGGELRRVIARIETARRHIITEDTRSSHARHRR